MTSEAVRRANWIKRVYLYGPVLVDATGTHRRLQALATLGWSIRALEQYVGVKQYRFNSLRPSSTVHRETAELVRYVYDQLWNTPAPAGRSSAWTKTNARKNGWHVPAAWDDDEIDDPKAKPKGVLGGYRRNVGLCQNGHPFDKYIIKSNGMKYGRCYTCLNEKRARGLAA